MSTNVQISTIGSQSDIMLIKIREFLDTVVVYYLQEKVDTLMKDGIFKYIIDLEELEHISSAGIGLFSSMALELRKFQGKLVFINVPDQVRHLFEITRLIEMFTLKQSIQEALTALEPH
jgi:anti-sigma B factor antagonist